MISRRDGTRPLVGGKENKYCPDLHLFAEFQGRGRIFFFFFPHAAPLRFESNTDSLRDVLDYINPSRDPRNLVDSPLRLNAPEPANFASLRRPAAPVHPSDAQMGFSELKGDTKSGGKKSGTFLVLHIICD